jgi:hypothetical protein
VAAWTRKAMGGNVLFQDAIKARLDIMKPEKALVDGLIAEHDFPVIISVTVLMSSKTKLIFEFFFESNGF